MVKVEEVEAQQQAHSGPQAWQQAGLASSPPGSGADVLHAQAQCPVPMTVFLGGGARSRLQPVSMQLTEQAVLLGPGVLDLASLAPGRFCTGP